MITIRIKQNVADALSAIRFVLSFVVAALVLVGNCSVGLPVFGLAVLTDPIDGRVAAYWAPARRWHGKSGRQVNAMASRALMFLVPGAITVRFYIAQNNHWSDASIPLLTLWSVGCLVCMMLACHLNLCKMYLRPIFAENAEAMQGWLYGFVLFCSAAQMNANAHHMSLHWWDGVMVATLIMALLAYHRWTDRPESRHLYYGKRGWSELYREHA